MCSYDLYWNNKTIAFYSLQTIDICYQQTKENLFSRDEKCHANLDIIFMFLYKMNLFQLLMILNKKFNFFHTILYFVKKKFLLYKCSWIKCITKYNHLISLNGPFYILRKYGMVCSNQTQFWVQSFNLAWMERLGWLDPSWLTLIFLA